MDFGGSFTTPCHLEILVSTLKFLNITIIDKFNLLRMDFGGFFTTPYHLEILLSTLKLWMHITWIFTIFF